MSESTSSPRYEYPLRTASAEVLQVQFSVLATINAVVAVSTLVLILGILRSKKVRSNGFNLYLLFMAIPDFIAAFLCLITCAMGAYHSEYHSQSMCQFQSFYLTFAFAGNAWTNLVIVHEVYKLLRYSYKRKRYFPPTQKQVFCRVAIVYSYAIAWGLLASVPVGLPIRAGMYYGLACHPMEYDFPSTLFFYCVYLPGMLLLPMLYSAFVAIHILRKGLLPKTGRNRAISIFLLRLIALYFVFWLPFVVSKVIGNFIKINPWIPWTGSTLSHFQGMFSSLCAFLTSDTIRHEMKMVLRCDFSDSPDVSLEGPSAKVKNSFVTNSPNAHLDTSGSSVPPNKGENKDEESGHDNEH